MGLKITDKKLKDKRFRRTEKAITQVFFDSEKVLSVRVIVKRAKISRATLYRHHGSAHEIVLNYENYILRKYSKLMRGLMRRRGVGPKTLYYQMLIFIMKNKDLFKMIAGRDNGRVMMGLIHKIMPKVAEVYRLPRNCKKMLSVYEKEVMEVLEGWVRGNFTEDEKAVLSDIMYLTETIRQRLMPLTR